MRGREPVRVWVPGGVDRLPASTRHSVVGWRVLALEYARPRQRTWCGGLTIPYPTSRAPSSLAERPLLEGLQVGEQVGPFRAGQLPLWHGRLQAAALLYTSDAADE